MKPMFKDRIDEFMLDWGIDSDGIRDELNDMLNDAYGDGFDDGCEHFVHEKEDKE